MQSRNRLDWLLGIATLAAIIGTVFGHRVSLRLEDVSFGLLLILIVQFVGMAWWRLARAWKHQETSHWRIWVSLVGCVALSLAFALPLIPFLFSIVLHMGFGPRWDYKLLMLGFGGAALVIGVVAAKGVRFPLVAGGLLLALGGLILPVGM